MPLDNPSQNTTNDRTSAGEEAAQKLTDAKEAVSAGGSSENERSSTDMERAKLEAEKLYEERIEEEYAKREGGA